MFSRFLVLDECWIFCFRLSHWQNLMLVENNVGCKRYFNLNHTITVCLHRWKHPLSHLSFCILFFACIIRQLGRCDFAKKSRIRDHQIHLCLCLTWSCHHGTIFFFKPSGFIIHRQEKLTSLKQNNQTHPKKQLKWTFILFYFCINQRQLKWHNNKWVLHFFFQFQS